jgi:DNA-binding phage protein
MNDFFDTPRRGRSASEIYAEFLTDRQHGTSFHDLVLCAVVRCAVERQVCLARLARESGLPDTSIANSLTHYKDRKMSSTVETLSALAKWADVKVTVNTKRVSL